MGSSGVTFPQVRPMDAYLDLGLRYFETCYLLLLCTLRAVFVLGQLIFVIGGQFLRFKDAQADGLSQIETT